MTKIKVTAEHLKNGDTKNCYACPVALALDEILKDALIEVNYNNLVINGKIYALPQFVREHIEAFDYGHYVVEPFEFELMLPECLLK